jgi:hypothetical protein
MLALTTARSLTVLNLLPISSSANSPLYCLTMTDSSNNDSSIKIGDKLPKLENDGTTNNYGEWTIQAQADLESWDLWKYIDGPSSTPPTVPALRDDVTHECTETNGTVTSFHIPGNAEAHDKILKDSQPWLAQDKIARARIFRALSGGQLHVVRNSVYAKQAWEALRDAYQPPNSALAQSKTTALQAYLCTPEMDVAVWLTDMQRLYNVLLGVKPDAMTDEAFAFSVLNQLPETSEWLSFSAGLRQRINAYAHAKPPTDITSREVITCIRDEHYFCTKNNPEVSAQVFSARSISSTNPKRTATTRPSDASGSGGSAAKRPRVQKTCTNSNCGRKGHNNTDCFAFGGGNQGNYNSAWRGPWNIHLPPSQRTRDNNVPPTKSHAAQANATIFSPLEYAPLDSTDPGPFLDCGTDSGITSGNVVFHTELDNRPAVATLPILRESMAKSNRCYYDSAANRHVFHDRNAFEKYTSISAVPVKGFEDNLTASAVGIGSVRLQCRSGVQPSTFVLTNVLHIPRARSNLVSGALLYDLGVGTTLVKPNPCLSYRGTQFLTVSVHHGMFCLETNIMRPSSVTPSLLSRLTPIASAATVHNSPGFCIA